MPPTKENPSETGTDSAPVSLSALLHNRDIPCPRCRYNLRNLTTDRCPECGHPLSIDLLLSPPPYFDHAYLLAIISTSIGLVISFAKWFEFVRWCRIDYGGIGSARLAAYVSAIYWLSLLPLFILLLLFRARFSRLPPALRQSVAVTLMILCLVFNRRYLGLLWR